MKSTGEVMGLADDFPLHYIKPFRCWLSNSLQGAISTIGDMERRGFTLYVPLSIALPFGQTGTAAFTKIRYQYKK